MSSETQVPSANVLYCTTEIERNLQNAIIKTKGRHECVENVIKKVRNEELDEKEKKVLQYFCNQLYQLIFMDNKRWSKKRNISKDFIKAFEEKFGEYSKNIIKSCKLTSSLSSEVSKRNKKNDTSENKNLEEEENGEKILNFKKITNENKLKSYLEENLLPRFVGFLSSYINTEKVEDELAKFQTYEVVLPGQSNDSFGILLEKLRVSFFVYKE